MCACACACACAYACVCACVIVRACVRACVCACVRERMCVRVRARACACAFVCACACVRACVRTCVVRLRVHGAATCVWCVCVYVQLYGCVCVFFCVHLVVYVCVVVEEVEGAQGCVWLCLYVRARVRVVREGEDECERDSMCSYVLSCAWQQSCCRRCTLDTPRTTSKLSRWRLNRSYLPGRIQTACVGLNRV